MAKQKAPIKILFLAADPTDTTRLRLGQELRDIRERLQLSRDRQRFSIESRESVRPGDLTQAIFDVDPQIIHFSGHGAKNGELCLENSLGKVHPVTPSALSALFKLISAEVGCVILNACYSKVQAKAISRYIPYVIGMSKEIDDNAAMAFSVGFYKALGADRPISEAHNYGCAELLLHGIQEHLTPVLLTRDHFNRLKSTSCDKEGDLHSLNSDIQVQLRVKNNMTATVKVYWLDYEGKRQHYFDVRGSEMAELTTYVTHPWVITKADHTCLGIFLPNKLDGIIILD